MNNDALQQKPAGESGRAIAVKNELSVLYYVGLFGHLRRAELGAMVWPESSDESRKKMLKRTLDRMFEKKLLLEKPNALGSQSLVLSTKGAKLLSDNGMPARTGSAIQGVQGPTFWHRTLGTAYLAEQLRRVPGAEVYGEYALGRGYGPMTNGNFKAQYGKIPDGLVLVPGPERGLRDDLIAVDWIEVESSYKPKEERRRVLDIGDHLGTLLPDCDNLVIDRLVIVYAPEQGHDRRMLASARAWIDRKKSQGAHLEALLPSMCVAEVKVERPLRYLGHEEYTLDELIARKSREKPLNRINRLAIGNVSASR